RREDPDGHILNLRCNVGDEREDQKADDELCNSAGADVERHGAAYGRGVVAAADLRLELGDHVFRHSRHGSSPPSSRTLRLGHVSPSIAPRASVGSTVSARKRGTAATASALWAPKPTSALERPSSTMPTPAGVTGTAERRRISPHAARASPHPTSSAPTPVRSA